MKVKTSELTGAALDWAVANCECARDATEDRNRAYCRAYWAVVLTLQDVGCPGNHPSTNWSQGGPIIEREYIAVMYAGAPAHDWIATKRNPWVHGPTPLIAAMRCYVASKLGDEVEIPEELK